MDYGYIVLANTKTGFISQAIKWFTNSQFSHSFVILPNILGVPMGIEASGNGVDAVRFDKNYEQNPNEAYQVWRFKAVSQDIVDNSIRLLLNDLEISYGFLQYPWFIWRKLNLLFGRDIKAQNNWDLQGMICSQVCVAHISNCNLQYVLEGYGKGAIVPQDLYNIFNKYPDVFELVTVKE